MDIKYRLKDSSIIQMDDRYIYIYGSKVYKIEKEENIIQFLERISDSVSYKEIELILGVQDTKKIFSLLLNNDLLITDWNNSYKDTIIEKQLFYFEKFGNPVSIQRQLSEKNIAILGMGGVGTVIYQNLIGCGINNFLLIDFDNIETNNLNRQFIYESSTVGKSKIDMAREYGKRINSNINVQTKSIRIKNISDLQFLSSCSIDLFINAADSPSDILDMTFTYCEQNSIPYISGGVGIDSGFWGPIIDENNKDKLDVDYYKNINNFNTINTSLAPVNTVISSMMSYDIFQYLINDKPKSYYSRIYFNLKNLNINTR